MPACGSTGRRRRVWYGGAITAFDGGALFALKGNKTLECWRYVSNTVQMQAHTEARAGVQAQAARGGWGVELVPNPLRAGTGTARLKGPMAAWSHGPIAAQVWDTDGRQVLRFQISRPESEFRLSLPAGVYLVQLSTGRSVVTGRVVVQK
jgi:hypothetical protein